MKEHQRLESFPETKSGQSPTQAWFAHIKKHKAIYFVGSIGVIGTNVAEISIPLFFKNIIDELNDSSSVSQSTLYYLVTIIGVQFVCRFLWRRFMAQQTHVVGASMKARIWEKARFFKKSRLDTKLNPGELMNIAAGDVGNARFIFGFTLVAFIDFIFCLLFCITAMLYISPLMTAATLALLPIMPFLLNKIAQQEKVAHENAQKQLSKLTEKVSQATSTVNLQRITQSQSFWINLLSSAALKYQQKRWKVLKISLTFFPILSILTVISYGVLIGLGLHLIFIDQLSLGEFIAFQSLLIILQNPLIEVGYIVSEWQRSITSLKRVKNTLDEEPSHIFSAKNTFQSNGSILYAAKDLSFKFPNTEKEIFSNLNFSLKKGEKLGIKGGIGTGKSTLIDVLAGFERNYQGSLKIFDEEIKTISHSELRKQMSIVSQTPFLFANSIRQNLSLDEEISDEKAYQALGWVALNQDIQNFPHGLDTSLGEWGVNLSGGQKQRLTLARALLCNTPLFLFDDCLSAVDTNTEEAILANIEQHFPQSSIIWVAHRKSTLSLCNNIMELSHD